MNNPYFKTVIKAYDLSGKRVGRIGIDYKLGHIRYFWHGRPVAETDTVTEAMQDLANHAGEDLYFDGAVEEQYL